MNHEFLAVGMTLIAGLSTGIGGLITYFSRKPNARFLSISLGFSAGVMLYVSMVELFAQSKETLSVALGGSGYPSSEACWRLPSSTGWSRSMRTPTR